MKFYKRYVLATVILIAACVFIAGCSSDTTNETEPKTEPKPPVELSSDNELTKFRIFKAYNPTLQRNLTCTINGNVIEGRITERDVSPRELVAIFETSGIEVYVGNTEQVSGVTINDFSKPVVYRVVAENGDENEYTVRLTRFTGIPILHITTASGLKVQRRSVWEKAVMRLDGGLDFDDIPEQEIEIKGRGNSTWTVMQQKPSYNIRLPKRQSVLGMPEHRRWSLLANYRDKTLMRNALSYFVAYRCSGLEWTSKYREVEIIFNGEFAGVYQLTEQIRVDPNRVNIDELAVADTDAAIITGGYLLEIDQFEDTYNEYHDFRSKYIKSLYRNELFKVNVKVPKLEDGNAQQFSYIQSHFHEMEKAVSERRFTEVYAKYLDLPSIIDQWLVYEISSTSDALNPNSYYIHKKRGDTKFYGGPVWDFDFQSYNPDNATQWRLRDIIWFQYLRHDPTFVKALKERWALLYPGLEEAMIAHIDEKAEYLRYSMEANWALHEKHLINESYANFLGDEKMPYYAAFERMKRYVEYRIEWMNNAINNM